MSNNIDRRDFLKISVTSLAALGISGYLLDTKDIVSSPTKKLAIPTRALGKTGHQATIFALGGQGTLQVDGKWDKAIKIIMPKKSFRCLFLFVFLSRR